MNILLRGNEVRKTDHSGGFSNSNYQSAFAKQTPNSRNLQELREKIREDFEKGSTYPFTCYAFEKEGPLLIQGDLSFEELRHGAYEEMRLKGHLNDYVLWIHRLQLEMGDKRHQLLQNPESHVRTGFSQGYVSSGLPKTESSSPMNTFSRDIPTNSFGFQTKSIPPSPFSHPTGSLSNSLTNSVFGVSTFDSFQPITHPLPNFHFETPHSPIKPTSLPIMPEAPTITPIKQSMPIAEVSLTEEEIRAFQAPHFVFQRIPEHAPPPDWCT